MKANEVTIVAASINEESVEVLLVNYSSTDTTLCKGQAIGSVQDVVQVNKEGHEKLPEVITEDLIQYGTNITQV